MSQNLQDKQPSPSSHYLGETGQNYFAQQNKGGFRRGRINARKFAPYIQPSDRVLDFGCGSGALLLHLNCKQRIGVEVNPAAIAEARAGGLEVHEALTTVSEQSVDVVVSNHALEHVPCPLRSLQELRSKLVPGGRLILCVPIDDWRNQKQIKPEDVNHHLYTWTPLLMGNLLGEADYQVEQVWVYTHAWPPYYWQRMDAYLPIWLFDLICVFYAWYYNRRQIMAIARNY